MDKTILFTDRLNLREFNLSDAPLLISLNSDEEVYRYTGDGPLADIDAAEKIIRTIILPQYKNKIGRWAVHIRETNKFIGWCGLKHIRESNETDLGYRFYREEWGKGYATEAAKACLQYGLEIIKLENVIARVAKKNVNSVKVLEKIGFKFKKEVIEEGQETLIYAVK